MRDGSEDRVKIEQQMSFGDLNEEYQQFVDKFKPKKTTDDCYTPPQIYEVVAGWVSETYGIERDRFIRPFFPGGDYERHPYKKSDVVVDNPPFSILSQIVRFYNAHGIPFFLFSPYLTCFTAQNCCHIITGSKIIYENGAEVDTAFVTNLDDRLAASAPELGRRIDEAMARIRAQTTKQLPKYSYPDAVLTAAMLGYMAKHDTAYSVNRKDAVFIRRLDSQKASGKALFGGGYLLSRKAAAEKAAAEKAAAEKAAAEKAAATVWQLSERELEMQEQLGG